MTDELMRIEFPGGYIRVNIEYLVMTMPMYDLDNIIRQMQRQYIEDPADEYRRYDDIDNIVNCMIDKAFIKKVLGPRRFWQIVKRLQRLGVCERWTQDTVIDLYKKEGIIND